MLKEGGKPVPRRTMCKITIIFWLALTTDFITSAIFIRSGYGSFEVNPYQRAFVENPSLETFLPWLMDLAAWYWFLIGAFGTLLYHFYNVKVENKKMGFLLLILKISLSIAMLIMASYSLLIGTASNTWLIFYKMLNIEICPILVQLFLSLAFIILPFKRELTKGMCGWAKHIHNVLRKHSVDYAKVIFTLYFSFSILLSLVICIRLLFPVNIALINVIMYWILFFIIPLSMIAWLYKTDRRRVFLILLLLCGFCELLGFLMMPIFVYLLLWFPLPILIELCANLKHARKEFFRKEGRLLVSGLIIAILLPNLTAYICVNSFVNQVASISNEPDKTSFISQHVRDITAFGWVPRAGTDFWKFILSGAGSCGEMAMVGTRLMNDVRLVARAVSFPGEDHSFIEVNINGEWLVADPGYYAGNIMTRLERASRRIGEFGAISYVVAFVDSSFIELTQEYVPTDTIIIRVTLSGEPLANAQVVLKHRFMSKEFSLPTFYTDMNGTVTLHLGAMNYNDKAKEYEPYYRIFVEGKDTGFRATSTGTGRIHCIEIDFDVLK
ncbi:MAG: hypothetical protein QXR45_12270 [Candidatus Bathyarchaeia archaeon]